MEQYYAVFLRSYLSDDVWVVERSYTGDFWWFYVSMDDERIMTSLCGREWWRFWSGILRLDKMTNPQSRVARKTSVPSLSPTAKLHDWRRSELTVVLDETLITDLLLDIERRNLYDFSFASNRDRVTLGQIAEKVNVDLGPGDDRRQRASRYLTTSSSVWDLVSLLPSTQKEEKQLHANGDGDKTSLFKRRRNT